MALTVDEVRHIANLARLKLSADEEKRYADQLSADERRGANEDAG